MSVRRRLALWLDPTLAFREPPPKFGLYGDYRVAKYLEQIAKTLERIERKTARRRPRIFVTHDPRMDDEAAA